MTTSEPQKYGVGRLPDFVPLQAASKWKQVLHSQRMPYLIAPVLLLVFAALLTSFYFNSQALSLLTTLPAELMKTAIVFSLMAIGAGLVLASGQLDLSSIGVATMAGVIFSLVLSYHPAPNIPLIIVASASSLAFAVASGALVSFCFQRLKAPLLILTWALGSIYIVTAIVLTNVAGPRSEHDVSGIALPLPMPPSFWSFGHSGFNLSTLALVVAIVVPAWTNLVDRARATGGSEQSATYAGVPIVRTYYETFIVNACLAAAAGIFQSLYLDKASTSDLRGNELIPIAIAVLGGTSLVGGYLYIPSVIAAGFFWSTVQLLGPRLPSLFPFLGSFQSELGEILFFGIFLIVSVTFGKLLRPPLQKVFARQEN